MLEVLVECECDAELVLDDNRGKLEQSEASCPGSHVTIICQLALGEDVAVVLEERVRALELLKFAEVVEQDFHGAVAVAKVCDVA